MHTAAGFIKNKDFIKVPSDSPKPFVLLASRCLNRNPKKRPEFIEIKMALQVQERGRSNGFRVRVRGSGFGAWLRWQGARHCRCAVVPGFWLRVYMADYQGSCRDDGS